ncbi:hypothetical protein DO021_18915 [Desulfobacter hydrogenophilus]|uniref:Uncharacterized protein n=1 Tax=Desulfobacter hydrogenophilus TaxID=2291 RepID=A0A328FBQ4_9BACT|nr:hypothetical protein [Desulfobacter hydrogenophilus]NDY73839.1 hypothetical protein [Desulfobacter hydrogenophilus]QBH13150.1 hypothetical protein EYB58_09605 [Desulfobacter hydrogenophilus]RAM00457.1 hypothetical protein DO021_18915 [Desulfobacter hydrogenophilus]
MSETSSKLTFDSIWGKQRRTMTADTDLELVLVDGARLPLSLWRKHFFFKGGLNLTLKTLTRGIFPAKANPKGTHPIVALNPVAGGIGFSVCPCSSSGYRHKTWVDKGTSLFYTGHIMEKTTYFVDHIRFNIPASEAVKLRFKGEIPVNAIQAID